MAIPYGLDRGVINNLELSGSKLTGVLRNTSNGTYTPSAQIYMVGYKFI